jgi:hypothetical protein
MEDKWAREFLVQQAKDEKNAIEFYDYSVKDAFDSKWKTDRSCWPNDLEVGGRSLGDL